MSRIKVIIVAMVIVGILVFLAVVDHPIEGFEEGQLVRHRMDGRIGIVTSSGMLGLKVRWSYNYTSQRNFEELRCYSFELVRVTELQEEYLYWRTRERPVHSPDQTELPR